MQLTCSLKHAAFGLYKLEDSQGPANCNVATFTFERVLQWTWDSILLRRGSGPESEKITGRGGGGPIFSDQEGGDKNM